MTLTIAPAENAFACLRDKKPFLTPKKNPLILPNAELAQAIAAEWEGGRKFTPKTMPMTSIAFTAIDVVSENFDRMAQAMLAYAETDLLCYRSEQPALRDRQEAGWDPVLEFLRENYHCRVEVTEGVMPLAQPEGTLETFARLIDDMDAFELSAFSVLVQAYGSLMLAFAVQAEMLDSAQAFKLSRIDEDYQAEQWGEDSIALARAQEVARDVAAAAHFLRLLEH